MLLGETVELATAYKFKTQLEKCTSIAEAADVVRDACQCGLMASMELARRRLQELAAVSSEFAAIAHAAWQLGLVVRYGDVRKFDPAPLLPLIEELFVQGALALFAAASCDNEAAKGMLVGDRRTEQASAWSITTASMSRSGSSSCSSWPTPTTAIRCSRATPARSCWNAA